jgi:hypothetical protein
VHTRSDAVPATASADGEVSPEGEHIEHVPIKKKGARKH